MGYFAQNLKFLRSSQKLSQELFAQQIGLNRGNIASYEKGTAEPSLTNLLKIARFFRIDVEYLLEGKIEDHREMIESLTQTQTLQTNGSGAPVIQFENTFREKLLLNKKNLEDFRKRSDEMSKILEGFRQFHKFKMESSENISEDVRKMAIDYEKLMEVLEDVLNTNKNIISMLEQTSTSEQGHS
ncbi:MAG: helix-turn-helix domain-containing protein [Bacteroidales bacterium]|nr:helix-turn-helix domain-containing protein [Bacteroidales bacterium]